ncbi:MAG: IclR family transcriptional regulator [Fusobacterium sp.]|uniref:IclR family transcriptional regulator n=1 Tax=Fusobacterium sp. TaxID=68766 RepID=UPI0026DB48F1|nr:IclR family transcriptional regulator [Fusobacterium sp.]MDO4690627.1 IclR family transcriptional regulator [Fusobacterium sp.]
MIKSLNKAVEILEILKNNPKGCSLLQIYTTLGIPKTTAYGILKTLIAKMYVLKDEDSLYKLGPALIFLGKAAIAESKVQDIALPVLRALSTQIKVDSFLMIPIGYRGSVLESVDGEQSVRIIEKFGNDFFLHCGAMRKAILANKDEKFIDEYISNVIESGRYKIEITASDLRLALKKIKEEGVAVSYGEYAKGTVGVGAPIYDYNKKVVASVGINLLESKELTNERIEELKKIIRDKGKEISKSMGYI